MGNHRVIDAVGVRRCWNLGRVVYSALTGLLVLGGPAGAAAQELDTLIPRDAPAITYIGNAGVFLSHQGQGVLIDALVRRGIPPYVVAPAELREKVEGAESPYDRVKLVLATHHHADHFDAGAVWRHLDYNSDAVFVSTSAATAQVIATPSDPELEERVIASEPREGKRDRLSFAAIEFDVLSLHHGRERRPPVANIGFVVNLQGFRVLHVGDTEIDTEELIPYALHDDSIDVALIPYWLLVSDDGKRLVDSIKARRLVAIHVPAEYAAPSYFGPERTLDALVSRLERDYPGIVVFREPLQRVEFPRDGS